MEEKTSITCKFCGKSSGYTSADISKGKITSVSADAMQDDTVRENLQMVKCKFCGFCNEI